jgi:hypothetical protein
MTASIPTTLCMAVACALLAAACGPNLKSAAPSPNDGSETALAPPAPKPRPSGYADCKAEYERLLAPQREETKSFEQTELRLPATYGDFLKLFGEPFKEDDRGQSKDSRAARWFRGPAGAIEDAIAGCVESGELQFFVGEAVYVAFSTTAAELRDSDPALFIRVAGAFPGEVEGVRLGMSEAAFRKTMVDRRAREDRDEELWVIGSRQIRVAVKEGVVTSILFDEAS